MNTELSTTTPQPPAISVGNMLQSLIDSGITESNVGALERMMDLYERNEARMAEQEFAKAFVELQQHMPRIEAVKKVLNKDGSERYRFAPYEEIMKQVQPLLTKYGFTASFDTRTEAPRITVICTLTHKAGHSRKNEFAVSIGNGPPGSTPTQADGAAKTYAKRGALSDALNIVTTVDTDGINDARIHGASIPEEEADRLQKRVKAARLAEGSFLDWVGVDSFIHVPINKMAEINTFLIETEAKIQRR